MNVARRRAGATRAGSAHCTWIEGAAAVAWVERAARSPGRRVHFTLTRASPGSSPGSAQATATHPGLRSNSRSERRLLTEVIEAVDRRDFYFAHVEVRQDRFQELDRNKHIPRQVWIGSGGIAQDEGADAQQRAVFADQRCAAPVERRRRGEDRPVEEIFPIARE